MTRRRATFLPSWQWMTRVLFVVVAAEACTVNALAFSILVGVTS